ncbi:hypothetical protein [Nitrospira sp. Ecomares 2.1]
MAIIYDQQADKLQSGVTWLEQRAISLAQKSHMESKGFRRTGLMHISALHWEAARELRELATMHREEGQRLLASEKRMESRGRG